MRILFDPAVVPDSSVDIGEVLLRAHAAARMSPGVHLIGRRRGLARRGGPTRVARAVQRTVGHRHAAGSHVHRRRHPGARRARRGGGPRRVHHRPRTDPVPLVPDRRARRTGHRRRVLQHRAHPGGGSHLTAAVKGLSEALADRASRIRDLGLAKGEDGPEAQDFAAVTALAVDTRAPDVAWDSQAKTAVSSRSLNVAMAPDVARSVTIWAANPANGDTVSLWTKLALEAARARRSAEGAKARSRAASKAKGLGTNLSLPPKLLPSRETGRGSGAELFLCEGDSALGTIKAARDATFQAAFPLKGKPPNVYGFTLSKARVKDEFDSIERILGCGVRDHCDPESCRYDRILFASDADPDGGNINSSLISMFLDFYRPLVKAGMVYVTLPPLFVVKDGQRADLLPGRVRARRRGGPAAGHLQTQSGGAAQQGSRRDGRRRLLEHRAGSAAAHRDSGASR